MKKFFLKKGIISTIWIFYTHAMHQYLRTFTVLVSDIVCPVSAMFVDIADNHSVVDRVKLSYIYEDVDNEEVTLHLSCTELPLLDW